MAPGESGGPTRSGRLRGLAEPAGSAAGRRFLLEREQLDVELLALE